MINLSHRNVITFSQPLSFIKPQLRLPGSCCTQLKLYMDLKTEAVYKELFVTDALSFLPVSQEPTCY